MSDGTHIEWTDATVNAVNGCSVLSAGCTNCYAMRLAGTRLKHHPSRAGLTIDTKAGPVWNGTTKLHEAALLQPLRWKRPRRIFWNAHGDLFHESVPDEWIDRCFAVMALTPQHTHQVLTKRAERMRRYVTDLLQGERSIWSATVAMKLPGVKALEIIGSLGWSTRPHATHQPLPNVWLGTSVEDQRAADERIPHLLETPAAVRFLSCEPLLGPIDLEAVRWAVAGYGMDGALPAPGEPDDFRFWSHESQGIRWVIVGGESGRGARPMHPDWARSLRDQCAAAGVAFFFKQWGEFAPGDHGKSDSGDCRFLSVAGSNLGCDRRAWAQMDDRFTMVQRVGKQAAGRLLDGVEHSGMPV